MFGITYCGPSAKLYNEEEKIWPRPPFGAIYDSYILIEQEYCPYCHQKIEKKEKRNGNHNT